MRRRPARGRKLADLAVRAAASLAALLGISALVLILFEVARRGLPALDPAFFTALPGPPGVAGGGLANAILGTLALTFAATLVGVPLGMLAGVYLSEFGRDTRLGAAVRFCVNVLMGLPSIIVGLFVWTVLVVPFRGFSGHAGAVALALIMLPVVARTTEDMLSLVPHALREGALAVGTPRWRATLIAFRAARGGLITGVLLAVARVSGETAPLLFTALNSPFWPRSMSEPVSNLTVTIFQYAMSPYADWQAKAWGASLLIMAAVLTTSLLARTFARERVR
ncbi:MAG: phosphate ABC transporter permease PstA [Candidatus Latescibacteria bacterium]|nr:phosphate ABC transporter permease PstA [Candidatus Latescibacterota bacterium]